MESAAWQGGNVSKESPEPVAANCERCSTGKQRVLGLEGEQGLFTDLGTGTGKAGRKQPTVKRLQGRKC